MSADAAINRLLSLHPKGFDLSLERVSGLLARLGNPQDKIPPALHIAGTNGKGSVSAFLRAILEQDEQRVHVHTSPHLVRWHERYRLGRKNGGRFVSDSKLKEAVERAEKANGDQAITVFEIMSAVGFLLFSEARADYSIMEVGLGGRFDATNVIKQPALTLITPIALDHEAYLGDTLAKIAFEKAGIIKPGVPVIIGEQDDEALGVLREVAEQNNAPMKIARQDFDYYPERGRFIFSDEGGLLDLDPPRLLGAHQLANAAMAIAAIRQLSPDTLSSVFSAAMRKVYWPGRFEHLPKGRLIRQLPKSSRQNLEIWIDGGHNPQAGKILAAQLEKMQAASPSTPLVLICGMLTTKEPEGYFSAFKELADKIYCVPVESEASFTPQELVQKAIKAGLEAVAENSVASALEKIVQEYPEQAARILISGSLYLVGDVLAQNGTPPK